MRNRNFTALILSLIVIFCVVGFSVIAQRPSKDADKLFTDYDYLQVLLRSGWHLAGKTDPDSKRKEMRAYYDQEKVTKVPETGFVQTWTKIEDVIEGKVTGYTVGLEEYDCSRRMMRLLQVTEYDADSHANVVSTEKSGWQHVTPNTLGERTYDVVCLDYKDEEVLEMDAAASDFSDGRVAEKKGNKIAARVSYKAALGHAPSNKKILEALGRVSK